jgi:SAM-dependent methyltransferase
MNIRQVIQRITFSLSTGTSKETRHQSLTGDEWHKVLVGSATKDQIINRVRNCSMSDWNRLLVESTRPGESLLEIGSGTGEMSLLLAHLGRRVTLLDISNDSLRLSESCAAALGLSIKTVQADVRKKLHFSDNTFDCSWSSGLLEHFSTDLRRLILKEQARITRGRIISFVPNSACLAYRIGKADQESRGVWPYGLENPLMSQKDDFAAAGITVTREFTVGAKHAISFLRQDSHFFRELSRWILDQPEAELLDYWQGYLIVTEGIKTKLKII